ncbi:c-type cytochrome biogenesis protein CcsB [Thermosulfurimonas sp. F29]|uniref:c-type cytochrome biogenesis protein CcsB n=1 Tax=Thermosulfurimonas sp. F29 TaxID=2867247 RepID=UPI001C835A88|nr:c-type cytochrome biogenesis protein CcsB [Thermosulfurimonas sp. F29]MBX6423686.1 c-type cytochrome biogenesis protein CcsB [Thermosulfurimonas sp. F29]
MPEVFFFKLAIILYTISAVGFFIYFYTLRPEALKGARRVLLFGFAVHTLSLVLRLKALKAPPVTSFHEATSFLAWSVVGVYFFLSYRGPKVYTLGTFLAPVVLFLMIVSAVSPATLLPLPPPLRSFWLPIHAVISLLSYAFFLVAAVAGLMYLLQERQVKRKTLGGIFRRLPPLESLDRLNEVCLKYGFPLLTLGIITGALWAEKAWGTYWSWDPKETWSLILWLIYAALLHERLIVGWRGRRAAFMALLGFVVWIISFFVVNLLFPGLHGYGRWT